LVRKPKLKTIALFAFGALLAAAGVARIRLAPQADIGAGFVAKQVCSCLFVGGRDEQACRFDLGPELAPVRMQRLADGVLAWVPLLAARSARFREGTGCTLE
jgi:hypothetical protein